MACQAIECSRCVVCIEEIDYVESKVPLKPDDIELRSVKYLDNIGMRESFVQRMKIASDLRHERIDDEVVRDGRNL